MARSHWGGTRGPGGWGVGIVLLNHHEAGGVVGLVGHAQVRLAIEHYRMQLRDKQSRPRSDQQGKQRRSGKGAQKQKARKQALAGGKGRKG